jgi:membrane protease YdiL (CAAX protease family)
MCAGLPVIMQCIHTVLGYTTLSVEGRRGIVLFVSLSINIFIAAYVLYIVCIKYRHSVSAVGLSLANASGNVKLGIKRYLIIVPLIILAGFVVNQIAAYYGVTPEMQDVVQWVLEEQSIFILASLIFFGIFIAPLIEEIIFRGFLQPALRNTLGGRYAVVASASLFAAVHMDVFAALQIFILGMLLGYLYEKTQTLVASVVVHVLHNSFTLVFLLFFKFFLKGKAPVF